MITPPCCNLPHQIIINNFLSRKGTRFPDGCFFLCQEAFFIFRQRRDLAHDGSFARHNTHREGRRLL